MVERSLVVADGDDTYRMLDSLAGVTATALDAHMADSDATFDRMARWMTAYTVPEADSKAPRTRPAADLAAPTAADAQRAGCPRVVLLDRQHARSAPSSLRHSVGIGPSRVSNAEAVGWLTRALDIGDVDAPTKARLFELAGIHVGVLDVAEAPALLQSAVTSWRQLGAPEQAALALVYLGMDERWLGDLESAAARQDEAIALAESAERRLGPRMGAALVRDNECRPGRRSPRRRNCSSSHAGMPNARATRASSVGS